jgi:DNA helicase-4
VDEAQDLSPQFVEAISCLRKLNPGLRLIFVGDDWQAINRFAGSDVELFTGALATRFGKCATPTLATNYRSVRKVVLAGNALMRGQGAEAVSHKEVIGTIQLTYLDQVFVEGREGQADYDLEAPFRAMGGSREKFFKALYQLAIPDLRAGKTLGVLFRTNRHMGKTLDELEKQFIGVLRKIGWPREDVDHWRDKLIRFSTAHSFKGAERQTVFVVNPSAGSFPLINADSIELFRFFGDSVEQAEADERRLFYVAITRAEERLVLLSETGRDNDSPYLDTFRDLIETTRVPKVLVKPPQAITPPGDRVEHASSNETEIRDSNETTSDSNDTV